MVTKNNSLLLKIILLFVLSRLFLLVVASRAENFTNQDLGYLGSQVSQGEPSWVWIWANMDGRHFIWVATKGYTGTNFAYFPLYPLLIDIISRTGISPVLSGIFISVVSTLLASILLLKLVNIDRLKVSKLEILFLLFLFPFSFILNSVYTDALFLLLTTASLYFVRRGNWSLSGIFAFLSSFTRFSGLALFPALLIEWLTVTHKRSRFWLVTPLLNLAGFLFYTFILEFVYGDWRLFQTSMKAWKQEKIIFILQVIYRYLKIFTSVSPNLLVFWVAVMEFVAFFLYMALGIYVYRNIRKSYGIFMITLLFLVTITGTFAGTPRYLVHLSPAYLGLAQIMQRYPRFRIIYYPVTIALGIILTALFVSGRFVG